MVTTMFRLPSRATTGGYAGHHMNPSLDQTQKGFEMVKGNLTFVVLAGDGPLYFWHGPAVGKLGLISAAPSATATSRV